MVVIALFGDDVKVSPLHELFLQMEANLAREDERDLVGGMEQGVSIAKRGWGNRTVPFGSGFPSCLGMMGEMACSSVCGVFDPRTLSNIPDSKL